MPPDHYRQSAATGVIGEVDFLERARVVHRGLLEVIDDWSERAVALRRCLNACGASDADKSHLEAVVEGAEAQRQAARARFAGMVGRCEGFDCKNRARWAVYQRNYINADQVEVEWLCGVHRNVAARSSLIVREEPLGGAGANGEMLADGRS